MLVTSFEDACDRLSRAVDGIQFERLRWARTEGPMLEHLVELAHATVAGRPDLDLAEEGSAGNTRRFIVKVHGMRVVAVRIALEGGRVTVGGEMIERSKYRLADPTPHAADCEAVDAPWMEAAFQDIFGQVSE